MGSKFCNINIHSNSLDRVSAAFPQYRCFCCADGWVTVTSETFQWGRTQAAAKKLSTLLDAPVLSTEYFDDDYVEFALYNSGKLITRHAPVAYEGLSRRRGNAAKFIETLGLNMAEEPALKKAFAVIDCEESVYLLESFLGCPIFGVKDDCPPCGVPDRSEFEAFTGGRSKVHVLVQKNISRKNSYPYLFNDEGQRRCTDDILKAPFIYPNVNGLSSITGFLQSTIFCYTDSPEYVRKRLEGWLKQISGYPELKAEVDVLDVRVLLLPNCAVVQGYPVLNVGVDAPDISRMFKCFTAVCCLDARSRREDSVRRLACGFAYAGKLLAYGNRGEEGCQRVMPDISIESPWLTLNPGCIVQAFEQPAFWDAVNHLGEALGAPLYPFHGEGWQAQQKIEHLHIFRG